MCTAAVGGVVHGQKAYRLNKLCGPTRAVNIQTYLAYAYRPNMILSLSGSAPKRPSNARVERIH